MNKKRTKFGKFMYNITFKASKFLMKHMWLYYVLNYTWGIITTIIGWIVYVFVRLFLHTRVSEKGKFGPCHWLMIGSNWGGVSIGRIFLVADYMGKVWTLHTKCHETGHSFQNAIWGPLAIFLIYISSVCRYWYQVYCNKKCVVLSNEWYELFWAEQSATDIGVHYLESEK